MAQVRGPREVFLELLHGIADRRLGDLPALYAEETFVEHPLAPLGVAPLRSRDEVRRHFGVGSASVSRVSFQPANITIHETADPEVIVAEFEYRGSIAGTDEPFIAPCIFVVRVRDGEIVASRDYLDHLTLSRARGGLDELLTSLRG